MLVVTVVAAAVVVKAVMIVVAMTAVLLTAPVAETETVTAQGMANETAGLMVRTAAAVVMSVTVTTAVTFRMIVMALTTRLSAETVQ
jgi:hypothetical protein